MAHFEKKEWDQNMWKPEISTSPDIAISKLLIGIIRLLSRVKEAQPVILFLLMKYSVESLAVIGYRLIDVDTTIPRLCNFSVSPKVRASDVGKAMELVDRIVAPLKIINRIISPVAVNVVHLRVVVGVWDKCLSNKSVNLRSLSATIDEYHYQKVALPVHRRFKIGVLHLDAFYMPFIRNMVGRAYDLLPFHKYIVPERGLI